MINYAKAFKKAQPSFLLSFHWTLTQVEDHLRHFFRLFSYFNLIEPVTFQLMKQTTAR